MGEGDIEIEFSGERLVLTPERAALWQGVLLLADTHWGKTETHRAVGVPLPNGDLDEQLDRLGRVITRTGAEHVVVVGDLIHAGKGITPGLVSRVASWRRAYPVPMTLVVGNHDRAVDRVRDEWRMRVVDDSLRLGSLTLRHEPTDDGACVSGHIHPVVRVRGDGDSIRVPCYWISGDTVVLPAFSTFTGGERVWPGRHDLIYAIVGDRVTPIESGMLSR